MFGMGTGVSLVPWPPTLIFLPHIADKKLRDDVLGVELNF